MSTCHYLSKFWIVPFSFKSFWRRSCFQRCQQGSNEAEIIAKKMNDEFVSIEHWFLAILVQKVKFLLKTKALPKRIESSHWRTRKGERVTSASAEETYNSLNKYVKLEQVTGKLDPLLVAWWDSSCLANPDASELKPMHSRRTWLVKPLSLRISAPYCWWRCTW
jgi:hypothetical protein